MNSSTFPSDTTQVGKKANMMQRPGRRKTNHSTDSWDETTTTTTTREEATIRRRRQRKRRRRRNGKLATSARVWISIVGLAFFLLALHEGICHCLLNHRVREEPLLSCPTTTNGMTTITTTTPSMAVVTLQRGMKFWGYLGCWLRQRKHCHAVRHHCGWVDALPTSTASTKARIDSSLATMATTAPSVVWQIATLVAHNGTPPVVVSMCIVDGWRFDCDQSVCDNPTTPSRNHCHAHTTKTLLPSLVTRHAECQFGCHVVPQYTHQLSIVARCHAHHLPAIGESTIGRSTRLDRHHCSESNLPRLYHLAVSEGVSPIAKSCSWNEKSFASNRRLDVAFAQSQSYRIAAIHYEMAWKGIVSTFAEAKVKAEHQQ